MLIVKKILPYLFLFIAGFVFGCSNSGDYYKKSSEAVALLANGETEEGLELLNEITEQYPDSALAYRNKMKFLIINRDYELLNSQLDLMIKHEIDLQIAYTFKGMVNEALGNQNKAFSYYKKGHQISQELNLNKDERILDRVFYLFLVEENSIANQLLLNVKDKYADSEMVDGFGKVLKKFDKTEYLNQMLNLEK